MHASFEKPGIIEDWARSNGHTFRIIHLYQGDLMPDYEPDVLLIMGGPMNIYEYRNYKWLKTEKAFISEMIMSGKIVIGICLGAQMIADALGSAVQKNNHVEIGWFPVNFTEKAREIFRFLPVSQTVFHWHGETFNLPQGAHLLASSEACVNQAFTFGSNVFAFQFHMEVTEVIINDFVGNMSDELIPSKYVQSAEKITMEKSFYKANQEYTNQLMDQIIPGKRAF
jgi:GMP synthase-like glutamine amidotransferase